VNRYGFTAEPPVFCNDIREKRKAIAENTIDRRSVPE
jgi:hypothetical protein